MNRPQHLALTFSRAAFGVALVLVLVSAMPHESAGAHAPDLLSAAVAALPVDSATLSNLPDAMIDTTYQAELAIGRAYWDAVAAYVAGTHNAMDAAAALYGQGIRSFVDSTYAARDLSAAAYGGIAQVIVANITSVHESQVRSMRSMSDSMADGFVEAAAAYDAMGQWFAQNNARVADKLQQSAGAAK